MVNFRVGGFGFFALGAVLVLQSITPVLAQPDFTWTTPYDPDWIRLILYNQDRFTSILNNMKTYRKNNGEKCPVSAAETLGSGTQTLRGIVREILVDIADFDEWSAAQIEQPAAIDTDNDFFDDLEVEFEHQMVRDAKWMARFPSIDFPYSTVARNSWLLACNIVQCQYFDIAGRKLEATPLPSKIYTVEFDERTLAQTVREMETVIEHLLDMATVSTDLSTWVKSLNLKSEVEERFPRLFGTGERVVDEMGNIVPGESLFTELAGWAECRRQGGRLRYILGDLSLIPAYQDTLVELNPGPQR
ncbi:hypothetical protein ABW21_db0200789 [Orbilia brochopaga]|nr:hypothetical protein ABW21_db0200789 [Drechslerella brochopaga]